MPKDSASEDCHHGPVTPHAIMASRSREKMSQNTKCTGLNVCPYKVFFSSSEGDTDRRSRLNSTLKTQTTAALKFFQCPSTFQTQTYKSTKRSPLSFLDTCVCVCVCCFVLLNWYWGIVTVQGVLTSELRGTHPRWKIVDVPPHPVPPQRTWGGRILALYFNYVSTYTDSLLFLFERTNQSRSGHTDEWHLIHSQNDTHTHTETETDTDCSVAVCSSVFSTSKTHNRLRQRHWHTQTF